MPRAFKAGIEKLVGRDHQSTATKQPTFQPPLTPICTACQAGPFSHEGFRQAISSRRHQNSAGYCYSTTWHEISQSISNEACNWCHILRRTRDGLPADKSALIKGETVKVKFEVSVKYTPQDQDSVKIYLNDSLAATYPMVLYADEGHGAVIDMTTAKANLIWPWEDLREEFDAKALECIKMCGDHEYCPNIEETYLPTRVIDCSDPYKPRLIETRREVKGRYCALSYVWGGEQPQKTTKSNIDTYIREGIKVPLPQTITDAVLVTNKLGIQYLWVDALCIIQDSSEDKAKELGIMAHIYRDAHLTISVLSAYSAEEGFLPATRAPDVLPFYLADKSIPPGWMLLKCGAQFPGRLLRQLGLTNVPVHDPLNKRGWCLQESILSPRQLIFQPPNVSYKCRSFAAFKINGEPRIPDPVNSHILFSATKHPSPTVSEKRLHEQWWDILRNYSRRRITLPSDKLVAVASVAEILQSHLQDQYIAGLWRRNLLNDLLWQIKPPMGPDEVLLPRPTAYRAPTWSWASVDGELASPPSLLRASYEAEIQTCEANPKFDAYYLGEITGARLIIRAKIRPLMRDGRKCSFIKHAGTKIPTGGLKHWYWTAPAGNTLEATYANFSTEGVSQGGFIFDCLEGTEPDRQMNFYVLILHAGRDYGHWVDGLLLLQVEHKVEHYRRVAKFNFKYDFGWLDWLDAEPLKTVTLI